MSSIATLERRVSEMEAAYAPRRQVVTCWIEADASPEDQEAKRAAHLKALGLTEDEVELFVFVRWFSDGEPLPYA
jgi:hypothetical protein